MGLHPLYRETHTAEEIAQAEAELAARAEEETPGAGAPAEAEAEAVELPILSEDGFSLTYQGATWLRAGEVEGIEPGADGLTVLPAVDSEASESAPADTAESATSEAVATDGEQGESPAASDELPPRMASTAVWAAYAEQHPLDPPLDLTPRTGLRDEIAARYLSQD